MKTKYGKGDPIIDQKTFDDIREQIDQALDDIRSVSDNAALSSVAEAVGISKVAASTIEATRVLVETQAISLLDATAAAFDESAGAIAKLRSANDRLQDEMLGISSALVGVQRKKIEIDEFSASIAKLNEQLSALKFHIDSGIFTVAERCAKAISG